MSEETTTQLNTEAPKETTTVDIAAKIKTGRKKKIKNKVTKGRVYINSTYNNTIISITDTVGNVLVWGSAGKVGFKGSKKSTPFAGQRTMEDAIASTITLVGKQGLQFPDHSRFELEER